MCLRGSCLDALLQCGRGRSGSADPCPRDPSRVRTANQVLVETGIGSPMRPPWANVPSLLFSARTKPNRIGDQAEVRVGDLVVGESPLSATSPVMPSATRKVSLPMFPARLPDEAHEDRPGCQRSPARRQERDDLLVPRPRLRYLHRAHRSRRGSATAARSCPARASRGSPGRSQGCSPASASRAHRGLRGRGAASRP